jgi:RecQ-mediated genome instability protein 1
MLPALHPLHAQVTTSLQGRHSISVNPDWLNTFLTSRGLTPPPLPALVSTVYFRILASDITTSISPSDTRDLLPPGIDDVNVKERLLQGNVIVQVLDILDVGVSTWSQIEAIERVERGEEIRGREVIRTVNGLDEGDAQAPTIATQPSAPTTAIATSTGTTSNTTNSTARKLSTGPHKLLLQDTNGTRVLAFELDKIPKIAISLSAGAVFPAAMRNQATASTSLAATDDPGMFIGCKILLRAGTVVRRGMVMLTPDKCVVLGGKVESWDKKWKEERKERLNQLLAGENGGETG